MSSNPDIPILKRPAFFDGQRLTAEDLADVQQYHRELRWLHNRSLHNWGIAFGYAVTGLREERVVNVQPGYALDCQGRDLILSDPQEMAVPVVAGSPEGDPVAYYLTASYAEDKDLAAETRSGSCNTTGAVRRPEEPLLRWHTPGDYRRGLDIVLATIQVQNCRLAADVSPTERRNAILAQQPFVAAGQTKSGATPWDLWSVEDPDGNALPVGVTTTVSTTGAGFRVTPKYQAHVVGPRTFSWTDEAGQPLQGIVDGYVQIAAPTAFGFELRLILPQGFVPAGEANVPLNPPAVLTEAFMGRLQTELQWHVVWMGIEG
jgi:hypothetical protein